MPSRSCARASPTSSADVKRSIDLNCDLGEGSGSDAQLMPWVTSANIACGGHAGDAASMREALELAAAHGVRAGAHPRYTDRRDFGRRDSDLAGDALQAEIEQQIRALAALGPIGHVKPHGALYNKAARDPAVAATVAAAVRAVSPDLVLFALSGSELERAGAQAGLRVMSEVFADRSYQADGSLTPREEPGALIDEPEACLWQVLSLVTRGAVRSTAGTELKLRADTVCLHGDGKNAVMFAHALRLGLREAGIELKSYAS